MRGSNWEPAWIAAETPGRFRTNGCSFNDFGSGSTLLPRTTTGGIKVSICRSKLKVRLSDSQWGRGRSSKEAHIPSHGEGDSQDRCRSLPCEFLTPSSVPICRCLPTPGFYRVLYAIALNPHVET